MEEKSREEEIRKIWKDYRLFYKLLGAAALVGIGVLAGRWIYAAPDAQQAWGYGVNLYTSIISIAVTVLILDELNRRRSERDAEAALKRQLVDDAASISNEVAKNAIHQIRRKGWLEGDNNLLKGANLDGANLEGVSLQYVSLEGTSLFGANLQKSWLMFANLQRADLESADLQSAELSWVNLYKSSLGGINLCGANLAGANLHNASFVHTFGEMVEPQFDKATVLPNGKNWTSETDMSRFTNSNHPDFWRSDEIQSPAYRGWD